MGTMGAVLALSACATPDPSISHDLESAQMIQAQPVKEPAVPLPVLMDNPVKAEEPPKNPMLLLRESLKDAKVGIVKCGFKPGVMTCPWEDGRIYEMFLKSGETSKIYLSPDEELLWRKIKEERFTTKDQVSGSPEGERDVLLVEGWGVGSKAELLIGTNKREYHVILRVNSRDYNPIMKFIYPEDVDPSIPSPEVRDVPMEPMTRLPLSRLHLAYTASGKIDDLSGDQLQVFDDGRKTYVVFPDAVSARPPYFAKTDGHGNNVEMTTDEKGNYIIKGVFKAAELQYGDKVIKIKRGS